MLYNICFGIFYLLNSNVLLSSSAFICLFIHPSIHLPVRSFVHLIIICWLIDLQDLKQFYRDQIFLQRFPTSLAVRKNVTRLLVTRLPNPPDSSPSGVRQGSEKRPLPSQWVIIFKHLSCPSSFSHYVGLSQKAI